MKLLDLNMDYFMENIAIGITESREERLSERKYDRQQFDTDHC